MTVALEAPLDVAAPVGPVLGASSLAEARAWLARELHDGAVQRLTFMTVELEGLRRRTGLNEELGQLQKSARAALNDLRSLLYELRAEPAMDSHFVDSIRAMVAEMTARTGMHGDIVVRAWPAAVPSHHAAQLRRIVGEALTNARRHSGAGRVTIILDRLGSCLAVTVTDDGRGIADARAGFGLRGMRERAGMLGGAVALDSAPGRGTSVHCTIPIGEAA